MSGKIISSIRSVNAELIISFKLNTGNYKYFYSNAMKIVSNDKTSASYWFGVIISADKLF
jgi:hypothetical protein